MYTCCFACMGKYFRYTCRSRRLQAYWHMKQCVCVVGWGWRGEKLGSWTEVSSTIALNSVPLMNSVKKTSQPLVQIGRECISALFSAGKIHAVMCSQVTLLLHTFLPGWPETLYLRCLTFYSTHLSFCRKGFAKLLSSVCALTVIFLSAIPYTVLCHQLFLLKYV